MVWVYTYIDLNEWDGVIRPSTNITNDGLVKTTFEVGECVMRGDED